MSTSKTTFYIEWGGSYDISIEEAWPDGDAPENPTTDDVVAQMLKCRSLRNLASEWMLDIEEVEVSGPGGRRSVTDRTFRESSS